MTPNQPPPQLLAALNDGVAHHRAGRLEAAELAYRQALALSPNDRNALRLLSGLAIQRENWPMAQEFAERALARQPQNGELHRLLAIALMESGEPAKAVAAAERALALGDGNSAKLVLANARLRAGDAAAAKRAYRDILRQMPDNAPAHFNLGELLLREGANSEGAKHLRAAIEIEPNHVEALRAAGNHALRMRDWRHAARYFGRLSTLRAQDSAVQRSLGAILAELNKHGEAVLAFKAALAVDERDLASQVGLAQSFIMLNQPTPALRAAERALALDPENADAHIWAARAYDKLFYREKSAYHHKRAAELPDPSSTALMSWCFDALYDQDVTPAGVLAAHRRWAAVITDPITAQAQSVKPAGRADKKLRIGYVSADLKEHVAANFIAPVLANHDRAAVSVYCYFNDPYPDALTAKFRKMAEHWRDIADIDDDAVDERIRQDHIDVLIDLSGYTAGNRLTVFARRPAPVQISWLGYPATTGMTAMDWRISDGVADPHGSEDHYAERLLRLPRGHLVFAPPPVAWLPGDLPALRRGFITFACYNNLSKLQPQTIAAWARILLALPDAKLELKEARLADARTRGHIEAEFAAHGIGAERLTLLPATSRADHIGRYREVDIALDTFPYNGGTTTFEALWMGVPVLTVTGDRYVARLGASILHNAGLDDWIASSVDDYVAKAIAHAKDVQALAGLRGRLRQQFERTLCDGAAFTRQLEQAYRQAWADAVAARDRAAGGSRAGQ